MHANPTFTYTDRAKTLLGAVVGGAIGAVVMGYRGLTNDRGLIIRRVIRFSAEGATNFYWATCLLSILAAVVCAIALKKRRDSTRRLELFDTYLLAPSSRWLLSTYEQVIPYKRIASVEVKQIGDATVLRIRHKDGKLDVERARMESDLAFAEFIHELVARVEKRQALDRIPPLDGTPRH